MNITASYSTITTSFERDRSLFPITILVILAHAILLFWSLFYFSPSTPMPNNKRLIVKTISLNEGKKAVALSKAPVIQDIPIEKEVDVVEAPAPIEKKTQADISAEIIGPAPQPKEKLSPPQNEPAPPEPKPSPKPKPSSKKAVQPKPKETKPIPKKAVKPKTPPVKSKQPIPKKAPPKKKPDTPKSDPQAEVAKAKKRELIARAQRSIGKIQQPQSKLKGSKSSEIAFASVPGAIQGLHIDALPGDGSLTMNSHEINYRDELASRLKLLLKLPEYGDVKIKLTLERSGKVANVSIISSESSQNRKYIEKTIPSLTFPPFGSNFTEHSQYVFIIKLSNEL